MNQRAFRLADLSHLWRLSTNGLQTQYQSSNHTLSLSPPGNIANHEYTSQLSRSAIVLPREPLLDLGTTSFVPDGLSVLYFNCLTVNKFVDSVRSVSGKIFRIDGLAMSHRMCNIIVEERPKDSSPDVDIGCLFDLYWEGIHNEFGVLDEKSCRIFYTECLEVLHSSKTLPSAGKAFLYAIATLTARDIDIRNKYFRYAKKALKSQGSAPRFELLLATTLLVCLYIL